MDRYEVIIYWSNDDAAYIAEVPELPGCIAHGGSRQEALANIGDAISLWLDTARELGRSIPEPKGARLMYARLHANSRLSILDAPVVAPLRGWQRPHHVRCSSRFG